MAMDVPIPRERRVPDELEWFGVETTFVGTAALLTVRGELDVDSREVLGRALSGAAARCSTVVIDLDDLRFVDAAGMGALVGASNVLRGRSGRLVLRRPCGIVARVLDVAGLGDLLEYAAGPAAPLPTGAGPARS